jgi:hypothetical protein
VLTEILKMVYKAMMIKKPGEEEEKSSRFLGGINCCWPSPAIILGSESGGTHGHILLSHNSGIRTAQIRENQKTGGDVEEEGEGLEREHKRPRSSKME